ncbi:hypothetical protein EMCRGX_G009797 [Ephydatia muelleri]|eukprot:Em0003g1150a
MVILGSPLGDLIHVSKFIAERNAHSKVLLKAVTEVADIDLHVAFSLLRLCASFCKHVHLSRTTPPSLCSDSLKFCDDEVRSCLSSCLAVDIPDPNWTQAQLSPSMGGFGLRSLSGHSPAAFISSLAASGFGNLDNVHLQQAVTRFNSQVSPQDAITIEAILDSPPPQSSLSKKARLLSVSAPFAGSWISTIPSPVLNLHLDSAECQMALRWWLGLNTAGGSCCPICPDTVLDPLGHHAVSCRHGGFVVTRHNLLRDILAGFCRRAHLLVKIEVGYGLSLENIKSRPADILVQSWDRGHPAAFDVTVTSPLTPAILNISSIYEGAAGRVAEARKHTTNDAKCQDLGWLCIPLAVETYGNWGKEAHEVFNRLASLLAFGQTSHKSDLLLEIYSHVNMSLVRLIARAILGRALV